MAGSKFFRRSGFRKTKKVFVVAMEGSQTEPIYFRELKPNRDASVRLILVGSTGHKSSPSEVFARLRAWESKQSLKSTDEAWIVIDRDSFPDAELDDVCAKAKLRSYEVAVSNPCFELWLWLHLRDNLHFLDRQHCLRQLRRELPGYEKGNYSARGLIQGGCALAIERAAALDVNPLQPWPRQQATRIHRLVQKLLPHVQSVQ
jgi:hypothetical protein